MAWAYEFFTSSTSREDLWQQITNFLNGLDEVTVQSAKVSLFDTPSMDDARGAVIYLQNGVPMPPMDTQSTNWARKIFKGDVNQNDDVLNNLVTFMNQSNNQLTTTQLCWSTLSADIDDYGTSNQQRYIILWYRQPDQS